MNIIVIVISVITTILLYGSVSQGLETSKFMNLIG